MTDARQTLSDFISTAILQHLADGLADKYQLAIVFYDHLGHPVTQPVIPVASSSDEQNRLQSLLKMILLTPPDAEHLGLHDGKAIYAGFFDGALRRSLVPIVFMQKYLGVCQYILLQPEFMDELKKWAFVLEGFLYDQNSMMTFLDSRPFPPSEEMTLITSWLQSQWQRLLESDRQRRFSEPEPRASHKPVSSTWSGSLITTRSYDVIEADSQAVAMLGYGHADEMVGVNFFSHLVKSSRQSADLAEFIENETPMQDYDLELVCKNGELTRVSITILPQKSFLDEPVGFQFLITDKTGRMPQTDAARPDASTPPLVEEEEHAPAVPPLTSDLRLQLRDLYHKIRQKSVHPAAGESSTKPLFVLDPENSVLVWNDAMQELLHIPNQAILHNPFDQLLLNESQQLWNEMLSEFRANPGRPAWTPAQAFTLIDNEGNAVHVQVHLDRNEVMGLELITVTVDKIQGPIPEKAVVESVQAVLPVIKNDDSFINSLRLAPQLTPSAELPRLQEQARMMSRNMEQALWTIFGHSAWTSMIEQMTKKQRSGYLGMQKEIERSFAMLRRLQYFSQAWPLQRRSVLLHNIIRQSSSLQMQLFAQPVNVRLDLDPQVGLVMADVSLLQQAIDFLCQNALEALQHLGDTLVISTRSDALPGDEEHSAVAIEIIDNGPGLHERVVDRLFEPFITTKQEDRGYGLGLAASYGIINSHQGELQVRSVKGQGTALRILLPAFKNAAEQAAAESGMFASRQNRQVLIVDDDPALIKMMQVTLESAGFHVHKSDCGEKALELFKKNRQHLHGAIIDLQLFGMSGLECAKKILQLKQIPIILSSGYPPVESTVELLQSCGGIYLEKPYGMSHLAEIARQIF